MMTKTILTPFIRLALRFFLFFCFLAPLFAAPPAKALQGANVGLYTDVDLAYSGAWHDGLTAIKAMLKSMNLTYEEIDYADLNDPNLNLSQLYELLFFPGGMAYYYNYWVCNSGKENIREFVSNGGGYFGICAGSFFAVDQAMWDDQEGGGNPVLYDDDTGFANVCGEPSGYSLNLFPGTGTGPLNEIASFYAPTEGWAMTSLSFTDNTVMPHFKGSDGLKEYPFSESILYYGGPYFTLNQQSPAYGMISNYQILATYDFNGQPAAVAFQYGNGRVVLNGPHPEIEEDSTRDRQNLMDYPLSPRKEEMEDLGSDWEMVSHMLAWLRNTPPRVTSVLTPPVDATLQAGGTFGPVKFALTNNSSSELKFSLHNYRVDPDGTFRSMGMVNDRLEGNQTLERDLFLPVPHSAPPGIYSIGLRILNANRQVLDQDHYHLQVLE